MRQKLHHNMLKSHCRTFRQHAQLLLFIQCILFSNKQSKVHTDCLVWLTGLSVNTI